MNSINGRVSKDVRLVFSEEERARVIYDQHCRGGISRLRSIIPGIKSINDYEVEAVCAVFEEIKNGVCVKNVLEVAKSEWLIYLLRERRPICGKDLCSIVTELRDNQIRSIYEDGCDALDQLDYIKAQSLFIKITELDPLSVWGQILLKKLEGKIKEIFYLTSFSEEEVYLEHECRSNDLTLTGWERARAAVSLYRCYTEGVGTDVDVKKGLAFLDKALEEVGCFEAAEVLGRRYSEGDGVVRNEVVGRCYNLYASLVKKGEQGRGLVIFLKQIRGRRLESYSIYEIKRLIRVFDDEIKDSESVELLQLLVKCREREWENGWLVLKLAVLCSKSEYFDGESDLVEHYFDEAVRLLPEKGEVLYERGRYYFGKKKREKAYQDLSSAYSKGHRCFELKFLLGRCYAQGWGVNAHNYTAFKYFQDAYSMDPENPEACFQVAEYFRLGDGIVANPERAFYLYSQAAKRSDDVKYHCRIATCYAAGIGVVADPARGYRVFCELHRKYPESQWPIEGMELCYRGGYGVVCNQRIADCYSILARDIEKEKPRFEREERFRNLMELACFNPKDATPRDWDVFNKLMTDYNFGRVFRIKVTTHDHIEVWYYSCLILRDILADEEGALNIKQLLYGRSEGFEIPQIGHEGKITDEIWEGVKLELGFELKKHYQGEELKKKISAVESFLSNIDHSSDAKGSELGREFVRTRVSRIIGFIIKRFSEEGSGEESSRLAYELLGIFEEGGNKCPDRATLYVEEAEVHLEMSLTKPSERVGVFAKLFLRNIIMSKLINVNYAEAVEVCLFYFEVFDEILSLEIKFRGMLYREMAKNGIFMKHQRAVKEVFKSLTRENLIGFVAGYEFFRELHEKEWGKLSEEYIAQIDKLDMEAQNYNAELMRVYGEREIAERAFFEGKAREALTEAGLISGVES